MKSESAVQTIHMDVPMYAATASTTLVQESSFAMMPAYFEMPTMQSGFYSGQ